MKKYIIVTIGLLLSASVSSTAYAGADDDVVNIKNKGRSAFSGLGGSKVGGFYVQPIVNVSSSYDDNIFATETNEESDVVTVVSPKVLVRSNWNRHAIGASVNAKVGRYSSRDSENYEDFGAAVTGRYDIVNRTFLDAGASVISAHESRASRDNVGGLEPTEYILSTGRLGLTRDLAKITAKISGEVKDYKYSDSTVAGGIVDNSDRDRKEIDIKARVGYELVPNYGLFVDFGMGTRKYDNTAVSNKDSDGWEVSVGTDINISGKMKGEVSVGYISRSYDAVGVSDTSSLKMSGDLIWNPSQITSVTGGLDASVDETSVANSSGVLTRGGFVAVDHELLDNVLLNSKVSYSNNSFEGSGIQFNDDIYGASLGVNYLWNRNFNLSAGYSYTNRDSNVANGSYVDNRVTTNFSITY